MTTNLLMLTPQVPDKALRARTTDTWGDTNRLNELANNRCGEKGNLAKLQTSKTGRTVISYDMGANGAQSVDTLAIARADLLTSDSVAALIVRAASAPYLAPSDVSSCVAWFDPSYGVTTDTNGGVSAWVDRVGGLSASQSTSASRPVLSRYDTRENIFWNSQPTTSGDVSSGLVSNVTYTAATSSDWASLFSTVAVFADNTATRIHYYNRVTYAAKTYTFSVYIRMDDGSAPSFSGSADFSLVLNGSATTSGITTESLGGGLYRISKSVAGSGSAANFGLLKTASNTAKGFKAQGFQLTSTSYTTYVPTTTGPVYAGINGSRHLFFDGVDDHLLSNSVATLLAGSDKPFSLIMFSKSSEASATLRNAWGFAQNAGSAYMRYDLDNSLNVARRRDDAATSASANGGVHDTSGNVWSVVFTGTAISIYKNGSAVINSGSLNVGTASFDRFAIGAGYFAGALLNYFSGSIADVAVYNTALGSTDRQSVEAYLTAKYITAPLVADYVLAGNSGEDSKDYVSRFTASSSSRHYWIEMESTASSKFTHSKLFLGMALDLGDTVDDYNCSRDDTQDDDFIADSGAVDVARGKPAPYKVGVTWRGDTITDTMLATFHDNIIAPSQTRFGLFLITTTNHEILDGLKSLYVRLKKAAFPRKEKTDYNIIDAEFEELPG